MQDDLLRGPWHETFVVIMGLTKVSLVVLKTILRVKSLLDLLHISIVKETLLFSLLDNLVDHALLQHEVFNTLLTVNQVEILPQKVLISIACHAIVSL